MRPGFGLRAWCPRSRAASGARRPEPRALGTGWYATAGAFCPLLAGTAALLAFGCGYHLVGLSSNLPPKLKTLYVAPFVNQTARSEVDQRLTEQISQEWVRRGRFELMSNAEKADAVLTGTVKSAVVNPVQFDPQGRATQYQLTLTIDVQLVDRTGEKPLVLWRDERFSRNTAYPVDPLAKDYFDREVEALDTLSRTMARDLVTTILEGF
jgi:outer membrane lipopolysaccharide assembly protein LptE/RlpB